MRLYQVNQKGHLESYWSLSALMITFCTLTGMFVESANLPDWYVEWTFLHACYTSK